IPLANAFLKAYAQKSPVNINLIDFFLGNEPTACAEELVDPLPTAVGFSMYVWNRDLCGLIAAELRRLHPTIILFCGGPEPTADPKSLFNMGIFDFVIVGEGEIPFLSLCQALAVNEDYSCIPGILLPDFSTHQSPSPISDLDIIPSPYLTGVIDTHSNPGILWQLSRGCSFTCDFCFDSRGIHGVRQFSLERLESELQYFANTGVSQIFVLDSTFNLDSKRAKKILRLIKKNAPDIHYHFEVRNEFIDREMAGLFASIACSLQIGLQSSDNAVLKLVGRTFNKADFTVKVGMLNESGAVFGFDLIYGLPGDTLSGFRKTLNYALSLYPNHLDIFPLAVLPGTRLASRGTALNLLWNPKPPYVLEATDSFSAADMFAASELAAACDIFYTRGKAVAWFNSIATVLNIAPDELLLKFSHWLIKIKGPGTKESDFSDDDIGQMQQFFLKDLFNNKKVRRFIPLVIDLVQYHNQYATVLLAQDPDIKNDVLKPYRVPDSGYKLAPAARIVHFTYEIEELLECGEPHIVWMYEHLKQSASQAVLYRNDGIIYTESLGAPYILLLENIRSGYSKDYISGTGLDSNQVSEFLLFALQEGILEKT
ncbi:MAG: radical SAM protein, partial [Desulfuromonadales bacterium]